MQSARKSYGDGERAHRAGFEGLKHKQKVGDHAEQKDADRRDPGSAL